MTGVRAFTFHDLFRCARSNDFTTFVTTLRTKVYDVIGGLNHVQVMLDDKALCGLHQPGD
jgi:hypothetical protein